MEDSIEHLLDNGTKAEIIEAMEKGRIEDILIMYREENTLKWISTMRPTQLLGYAYILTRDCKQMLNEVDGDAR